MIRITEAAGRVSRVKNQVRHSLEGSIPPTSTFNGLFELVRNEKARTPRELRSSDLPVLHIDGFHIRLVERTPHRRAGLEVRDVAAAREQDGASDDVLPAVVVILGDRTDTIAQSMNGMLIRVIQAACAASISAVMTNVPSSAPTAEPGISTAARSIWAAGAGSAPVSGARRPSRRSRTRGSVVSWILNAPRPGSTLGP
jgi:hypothetical protein